MLRLPNGPRLSQLALGVLVIALLLSTASGTSVKKLNLDRIVRDADLVFTGSVEKKTFVKGEKDHPIRIWTEIRFRGITAVKGAPGKILTVRHAGGVLDGKGLRVTGMPTLEKGKRYLVFLRTGGKPACPFVGWGQGVFRLVPDKKTGLDLVETEAGKAIAGIEGGRLVPVSEAKDKKKRLDEEAFKKDIKARVRRHEAEEREKEKSDDRR